MSGVLVRARCLSALLVVTLLSASCASYQPIKLADIPGDLMAGDTVKVVTRDGRESEFVITAITPDAIVGEDQRIELADVKELEKRGISPPMTVGKAVLVGVAILLVVGLLVGMVWAAGQGSPHPSSCLFSR